MSFLAASAAPDPAGVVAVAVGALAGASLRFIFHRGLLGRVPDAGSRRVWIVESVLAFGLGLLAGTVLAAGSGPGLSPPGWGVLAALAAYAGTSFAVSWMNQDEANPAPVVPAVHLLVTLCVSLAGAAVAFIIAGQF